MNPGINRGYDPPICDPDGDELIRQRQEQQLQPVDYRGDNLPLAAAAAILINETVRQCQFAPPGVRWRAKLGGVLCQRLRGRQGIHRINDDGFEPVNMFDAPDGTLYLLDMYRGVVCHGVPYTPSAEPYREGVGTTDQPGPDLRRGRQKHTGQFLCKAPPRSTNWSRTTFPSQRLASINGPTVARPAWRCLVAAGTARRRGRVAARPVATPSEGLNSARCCCWVLWSLTKTLT